MKHRKESIGGLEVGQKQNSELPTHCQACGDEYVSENNHKRLTTHHIWPQRHYKGDGPTEYLCQDCHTEADKLIPQFPIFTPEKYQKLFDNFIEYKKRGIQ